MRFSDATITKKKRPMVTTPLLTVVFLEKDGKITGIDVTLRKRSKHFKVVNDNILATWMKVERYFKLKI